MNDEEKESILSKISKLLSLATSDNVSEAESAAAKAQELLIRYNLSEDDLDSFNSTRTEKIIQITSRGKTARNRSAWYDSLANVVAQANLCTLLISGNGLLWIGKKTNIEVAQYIFENLVRDLTRICEWVWNEFNERQQYEPRWNRVHGKTWKNSFYHGAIQSIRVRLNSNLRQLEEAQPAVGALIVRNDLELKEYMTEHYPRLTYTSHVLQKNRSGFEAGKAAGNSVSFRTGVGAGGSSGPRLLNKG